MGVDKSRFPEDLEERIRYLQGRIDLYDSIRIHWFRSACTGIIAGTGHEASESDVSAAFEYFSAGIATPYREIDLKNIDEPVEFSFVYTILDLIALFEQAYDEFRRQTDNTSGLKDFFRDVLHTKALSIGGVSGIWERNREVYRSELEKALKQRGQEQI